MRAIALLALLSGIPSIGAAQELPVSDSLEVRVWLDRGDEPVLRRGEDVRVYYRASQDAYAAIFRIDTDGRIEMLFPQHPGADAFVRGGRDYRLLFPRSPRWRVAEDPGAGYFFIVASPEPMDFTLFEYNAEDGWDLSTVGATVYEDPYVAIDDYVATIVPEWEFVPYALDFLTYNVGGTHTYPRFLCYDCHGFRDYGQWNPYSTYCPDYSVVIWDDPYFYPRYRYMGTRVVYARPINPRPRYGVITRVAGTVWRPIVRTRPAPAVRTVYKEPANTRAATPRGVARRPAGAVGPGARPGAARGRSPASGTRVAPSARSGRRPSASGRLPSRGARSAEPTLQRRPGTTRAAPAPSTRARTPSAGNRSATGRSTPNTTRRSPPASTRRSTPNRATTPRAAPTRAAPRTAPARSTPRAAPTRGAPRATSGRPTQRAAPPTPTRSAPRVAPSRPNRGGSTTRATPRASTPRAAPSRAPARAPRTRSAPTRRPGGAASGARAPSRASGARAPTSRGPARAGSAARRPSGRRGGG